MPGFAGSGKAQLLRDNQQVYLWQNEAVAAGVLSVAFELARVSHSFYPWGLSCEVAFAGAPGAFEIDIMAANNDSAANFISIGTITTVNNANVARWDMPTNIWPKYIAGFVKTLTNAVNVSLQVTR
jgi:hypothetical protein